MSSGYRWEILPDVERGGLFLNYWDSLHGHDVCIEIASDGTAELVDYADDMEVRTPINLAQYLLEWLAQEGKANE